MTIDRDGQPPDPEAMSIDEAPDRQTLLSRLSAASVEGYLGLFVGTGFSKAATDNRAPNFEELLQTLARRLDLLQDLEAPTYKRKSFPQIASSLVEQLARARGLTIEQAVGLFRQETADVCNFGPAPTVQGRLSAALGEIAPNWIITTNYDLVLEALIDDAESVVSAQPLVARSDRVPIYHLHGHRHEPSSIRMTEEDYVSLLGPIDYRRLKLPLLLLESSTLLLGYALGDINVRSAMEWSRSLRGSASLRLQEHQGLVVQALRVTDRQLHPHPYFGPNGEVIIEIEALIPFVEELGRERSRAARYELESRKTIQDFVSNPINAQSFVTDERTRKLFHIVITDALPYCSSASLVNFIAQVLDPVWDAALQYNAFSNYDVYLWALIDILSKLTLQNRRPSLLVYLAASLNRIGPMIDPGKSRGSAHAATDRWLQFYTMIPQPIARELRLQSKDPGCDGLAKMIACVPFP